MYIRYGKAKSIHGDEPIYYRKRPNECIETWIFAKGLWDIRPWWPTWESRLDTEHCTDLEEVTFKDLPDYIKDYNELR